MIKQYEHTQVGYLIIVTMVAVIVFMGGNIVGNIVGKNRLSNEMQG